jgi:hypothetical protein
LTAFSLEAQPKPVTGSPEFFQLSENISEKDTPGVLQCKVNEEEFSPATPVNARA